MKALMLFYHESIEVLFIVYLKNKMITTNTNIYIYFCLKGYFNKSIVKKIKKTFVRSMFFKRYLCPFKR
jgi:hypothetical protein